MLLKIFYIVSLSLIFVSCGLENKDSQITFYRPPAIIFSPHLLKLDDPSCQLSSSTTTDKLDFKNWGQQNVHRFTKGAYGRFHETLNVGDDSVIKKILIPGDVYLGEFEDEKEKNNSYVIKGLSKFQPLYLCKSSSHFGHYSEDSIEMMALATYATVNESYGFYKKSTNKNILQSKKVTLLIGPLISTLDNGIDYFTDNAFYSEIKNYGDILAVIPHSDEKEVTSLGFIPFWKQQFVLAHEFGHYVFENHSKISDIDKSESHFRSSSLQDAANKASLSSRKIKIDINKKPIPVLGALHEGFADVFATLVTGEDKNNMIFDAAQRNVLGDIYVGKQKKYKKKLTMSIIEDDEFDEAHALGAILAHTIYRTIGECFPGADSVAKGKILISWADEILREKNTIQIRIHSISSLKSRKEIARDNLEIYIKILHDHIVNQPSVSTVRASEMNNVFHKYFPVFY